MSIPDRSGHARYFDEKHIPDDVWWVLRTASLLNIGEFRVFEIAYERWYGETGSEKTIEHHFLPYMFRDIVPIWVRHFCQDVIRRDGEGLLDPRDYGLTMPAPRPGQRARGYEYLLWILAALLALWLLAEATAGYLRVSCTFPPCY